MKTGPLAAALESQPDLEARLARPYLVPRVGDPGDPTALVTLLCSDAASWITGHVYPVDGGYVPTL
jgi:NAD(P)-dependent dehydrogenase (short-subunit alcohol dehydrogenase family)